MADTIVQQILRNSLVLSYAEIGEIHPEWSKIAVDDYFYKQSNINTLALSAEGVEAQVILNTENIQINADNIVVVEGNLSDHITNTTGAHAASAISFDNSGGLAATDVQGAIDEVDGDLATHVNADSAHGASGDVVGNTDFATGGTGGVVNLAANVADPSVTTTAIATVDVGAAPVVYSQAYTQSQTNLINECKAKINSLVNSDVLDLITQLNAFLAANQTAKQMA